MKKLLQNQKKNKFVLCVLLLALLASLALMTGCGNNDAQDGDADADGQDTAKKTLVVGLDDTFAPMGFRDEQGNLVGFDIDLATAVADELGMQAEFKPIDCRDGVVIIFFLHRKSFPNNGSRKTADILCHSKNSRHVLA